jgi:hypothetical protein
MASAPNPASSTLRGPPAFVGCRRTAHRRAHAPANSEVFGAIWKKPVTREPDPGRAREGPGPPERGAVSHPAARVVIARASIPWRLCLACHAATAGSPRATHARAGCAATAAVMPWSSSTRPCHLPTRSSAITAIHEKGATGQARRPRIAMPRRSLVHLRAKFGDGVVDQGVAAGFRHAAGDQVCCRG